MHQQSIKRKIEFAAVPIEVLQDQRMKLAHLRLMIGISWHDRMSAANGGQGCFKARSKLADLLGCSVSRLSDLLNDLVRWGYVAAERHKSLPGTNTYRLNFPPLSVDKSE